MYNQVQADLGLAVVGVAYERTLNESVAVQIEGQIFGTWFGPWFGKPNFKGVGAQVRPSFFLSGRAPHGAYIAPFFRADRVSAEADGITGRGTGWSLGTFVGYSFVLADRLDLRIGVGGQYMSYAVDAGKKKLEFRTLFPALDLVAGFMF